MLTKWYLNDVTYILLFFLIVKTDKHRKYLLCDAKKRQNYYGHSDCNEVKNIQGEKCSDYNYS